MGVGKEGRLKWRVETGTEVGEWVSGWKGVRKKRSKNGPREG